VHVNLQPHLPHLQFQLQLIVVVVAIAIIFMANACQMQLNECGLPTTTRLQPNSALHQQQQQQQ